MSTSVGTRRQKTDFLLTAGEILPPPHIVLTFWHPDLDLLILGIGFVSSMYTCTFTSADLQMIVFWPPSKYNLCAYTHYWSRNYTDSSRAKNKCTMVHLQIPAFRQMTDSTHNTCGQSWWIFVLFGDKCTKYQQNDQDHPVTSTHINLQILSFRKKKKFSQNRFFFLKYMYLRI